MEQRQQGSNEARAALQSILLGESQAMQDLREEVLLAAHEEENVLVLGESGTGKELVARSIRDVNGYFDKPFVTLNVPAMPASLVESELFGHRKGSFTGADENRKGVFEAADNGILLLDEIGDMPLELQAKLLRVLESGEVKRIGEPKPDYVHVRVIASTNHDLLAEVQERKFRLDLYHRLAIIRINVPPLRDHREDIPLLADTFLRERSKDQHRSFTPAALDLLAQHDWPGNVRELKNVVRRAAIGSPEKYIGASAVKLDHPVRSPRETDLPKVDPSMSYKEARDQLLKAQILDACRRSTSLSGIAKLVEMHRRTIEGHIKDLGIEAEVAVLLKAHD